MAVLNKDERTTFMLEAGQVVSLSGGALIGDSEINSAKTYSQYDRKYGPFHNDKIISLSAITSNVTYTISESEFQQMGYINCLNADLPTVGKTGVVYFTEAGLKYFTDITGQYLALNVVPSVPEMDTGGEPAITCSGDGVVDDVLTCSTGVWLYRPTSFSYQWYRGVAAIEGETGSTYIIVSADEEEDITCEVTGTNIIGDAETAATSDTYSVPAGV